MPKRPLVNGAGTVTELAGDGLLLDEIATPATPSAGVVIYPKADHLLYRKDSAGNEAQIGGSTSRAFAFFA